MMGAGFRVNMQVLSVFERPLYTTFSRQGHDDHLEIRQSNLVRLTTRFHALLMASSRVRVLDPGN